MSVISLCTIRVSETCYYMHQSTIITSFQFYFGELSPSTTGVTFTVVCSNNVMSCIEEETLELSLLQVSLFKISSEATKHYIFCYKLQQKFKF